jgi:type I restriction enzyme, S subunit
VDISAIDRATKQITNPQILETKDVPSRARQRLLAGDVIVSMTRPNLNAVALVPEALDGSIGSTGFHVLRSRSVSQRWLGYRVRAQDFVSSMSMKVQGALYPAVRPKDIAEFPVLIPPNNEQERVVAELEKQFTRLDAATAALKRVQANLKRYRASVLKAACEGRLVSAANGAETYSKSTVIELLAQPLANGRSPAAARVGVKILRLTALQDGGIDLDEWRRGPVSEAGLKIYQSSRATFWFRGETVRKP